MTRFPARSNVLQFSVFASLLCMVTKYGFSDVREQLLGDLKSAYPTKWEDFEAATVLGEDVFGSPGPHPNAVLNLFLEQSVKFALPFAAYRAGLGGPSALVSDKPGTVLPRAALASIIHGMGTMRRLAILATHRIIYSGKLGVCAERACVLSVGTNPAERSMEALKKVFDVMAGMSDGDMLSPLSFGPLSVRIVGNSWAGSIWSSVSSFSGRDFLVYLVWRVGKKLD